jgi:hypothetical protein
LSFSKKNKQIDNDVEESKFTKKTMLKAQKVGRSISEKSINKVVDPVTYVQSKWDNLLKRFYYVTAYTFTLIVLIFLGGSSGIVNVITLFALIVFPFFVIYQILCFFPTIKVGNKVIFHRKMFNIQNQMKWSYRIVKAFGKQLKLVSPQLYYMFIGVVVVFFIALMTIVM